MQDVKSIYRSQKKRCGRSAYLLSVQAEAVKDGKRLPVQLVFVRNRAQRGDYLVLVSTDLSLSEEEIIQTYGKRWNIEVFFKMCKSYLKLGKETRSISHDALTAHTSIVFTRYMMLALEQRRNIDERSIGELFFPTIDELEDLRYLDALALLLNLLMDCAKEAEILDEQQLNQLLELFLAKLPDFWGGGEVPKTVCMTGGFLMCRTSIKPLFMRVFDVRSLSYFLISIKQNSFIGLLNPFNLNKSEATSTVLKSSSLPEILFK